MTTRATKALRDPSWWKDTHTSVWERVKGAMKRDWEQTKADVHLNDGASSRHVPSPTYLNDAGTDLNQDIVHTLKQVVGIEIIPPQGVAHRESGDVFSTAEPAYRYGVGLSTQHATQEDWSQDFEVTVAEEWIQLDMEQPWEEAKTHVQRGFEGNRRQPVR
jgi:hypothetical protein